VKREGISNATYVDHDDWCELWFSPGAPACRETRPTVAGQRRNWTELSLDIENLWSCGSSL